MAMCRTHVYIQHTHTGKANTEHAQKCPAWKFRQESVRKDSARGQHKLKKVSAFLYLFFFFYFYLHLFSAAFIPRP